MIRRPYEPSRLRKIGLASSSTITRIVQDPQLWQTEVSAEGFAVVKTTKLILFVAVLALFAGTARSATHDIYPAPAKAKPELADALRTAAAAHKRILLDFGGNWCGDCQVLDIYFHNQENRSILEKNFVLVDINVGHMDENLDLARRYQIPLKLGVPALAVLSENGKLLYSQKAGEFEKMSTMNPSSVTQFLVRWRPQRKGCSVMVVNC